MVTAFKQKHFMFLMIDTDIISMNLSWEEKFSQDKNDFNSSMHSDL